MTVVGLVGCGRWGKNIVRDLRSLGVAVHVADIAAEARANALAHGAASVCTQVDELPSADGYIVAAPTIWHADIAETLLARGRPVFVEKPLSQDVTRARALFALAPERLFVMEKWRYHPGVEALAREAHSGALGDVLAVRTYRLGWELPHTDVDAAWILLPHDLSIAYEILGHLPPAHAAFANVPARPDLDMTAILRDATGRCQVVSEISTRHPVVRRAVVVIGTRACAQLEGACEDRIQIMDTRRAGAPPADMREVRFDAAMPLFRELEAFVSHLCGGPAPRSSAYEGLQVVERIATLRALAGLQP